MGAAVARSTSTNITASSTAAMSASSVPGDAKHPVKQEYLESKFRDCLSFAAKPIPASNVERAIEMIRGLENLSDAAEIVALFA